MNFPTFNVIPFVDKDGFLTPSMQYYHDDMNQTLRDGLSDNGWTVPQITAADLANIAPDMPDGTIWYDTDNQVFVGKVNDVLMKFTMAAYP